MKDEQIKLWKSLKEERKINHDHIDKHSAQIKKK